MKELIFSTIPSKSRSSRRVRGLAFTYIGNLALLSEWIFKAAILFLIKKRNRGKIFIYFFRR